MRDTLGQTIRRLRIRNAMSLDDLASACGVSKPMLSLIENGGRTTDATVERIGRAIGLPPGQLVRHHHIERTPHDVRRLLTEQQIEKFIKAN